MSINTGASLSAGTGTFLFTNPAISLFIYTNMSFSTGTVSV